MSRIEGRVVADVEAQLINKGAYFVNVHGSNFSTNGNPDIIACISGRFIGIEVKDGRNRPSIVQLRRAMEIVETGGVYFVAYADFDIDAAIRGEYKTVSVVDEYDAHDEWDTYSTVQIKKG